MNDFIAGPASGARQGGTGLGGGGAPPTVLIAALGAAVLIAATHVGMRVRGGARAQGTVTFEGSPAAAQCSDGRDNDGDGLVDEADPGCDADDTEAPNDRPARASDCHDGRDNDGDGLVDAAQDPGCASGGSEAGSAG